MSSTWAVSGHVPRRIVKRKLPGSVTIAVAFCAVHAATQALPRSREPPCWGAQAQGLIALSYDDGRQGTAVGRQVGPVPPQVEYDSPSARIRAIAREEGYRPMADPEASLQREPARRPPRIAVFSGPDATIQNSPTQVTSNRAREKYGLPLLTKPDGTALRFDALRPQRLAAPVTVYIEQFSAHP